MPSSTSNFDFQRPIPTQPWGPIVLAVVLLTAAATTAWEIRCRTWGYAPTLNDNPDLWAQQRRSVQPDSVVIVGDSRPHFDLDLDVLQTAFGQRPVQLALDGSCAYPVLAELASDESFHGTAIVSVVPLMFLAPAGPPMETSEKALKRYHNQTVTQRTGQVLGALLEEHLAFLRSEELDLSAWLARIPIPNRPGALLPPRLPPISAPLSATGANA